MELKHLCQACEKLRFTGEVSKLRGQPNERYAMDHSFIERNQGHLKEVLDIVLALLSVVKELFDTSDYDEIISLFNAKPRCLHLSLRGTKTTKVGLLSCLLLTASYL